VVFGARAIPFIFDRECEHSPFSSSARESGNDVALRISPATSRRLHERCEGAELLRIHEWRIAEGSGWLKLPP
jgi:hypothetical protein